MNYCVNCGTKIDDYQGNYCPQCGAKIAGDIIVSENTRYSIQAQTLDIRTSTMKLLTNAHQYFLVKAQEYNQYYNLINTLIPRQKTGSSAMLVWGIIITAIAVFILSFGGIFSSSTWAFLWIVFCCTGAGLIVGHIIKEAVRKKTLRKMISQAEQLDQHLYEYYLGFSERMFIGPEYTAPDLLICLLQIVRSGRADTLKDAISAFETDQHFATMESLQLQTIRAVQSVGRAARAGAIFAGLHFFL